LISEDFFINQIGEENIKILGKTIYYQNITWQEKRMQDSVIDDINETKASFDINRKTSYITNMYLTKDNDQ
jgi:hypothetical protein